MLALARVASIKITCVNVDKFVQVAGSTSKTDFACGVIRGLGGNLNLASRNSFAKEVSAEVATSVRRSCLMMSYSLPALALNYIRRGFRAELSWGGEESNP